MGNGTSAFMLFFFFFISKINFIKERLLHVGEHKAV